jgi:hypothetical protein
MNDINPATDTTGGGISAEEKQWAMFAHLSALASTPLHAEALVELAHYAVERRS